jgi:hypothetical protein
MPLEKWKFRMSGAIGMQSNMKKMLSAKKMASRALGFVTRHTHKFEVFFVAFANWSVRYTRKAMDGIHNYVMPADRRNGGRGPC